MKFAFDNFCFIKKYIADLSRDINNILLCLCFNLFIYFFHCFNLWIDNLFYKLKHIESTFTKKNI